MFVCQYSRADDTAPQRLALVVGVNGYQHPKLPTLRFAVRDAVETAEVLRGQKYQVAELTDETGKGNPLAVPTRENIERALDGLLRKCERGGLVVVAFAGHGLQFEGEQDAFFCPADARPFKDEANTLISVNRVYEKLDKSFAGMKVLLVDACRDDPTASRGVDADRAPRPPRGVAALFSCSAGERAFEHDALKHGVFFYHVLKGLQGDAADKKGRVTFAGLASHVGQEVKADVPRLIGSGATQSPNVKADYSGEPVLAIWAPGRIDADLQACVTSLLANGINRPFATEVAASRASSWHSASEQGSHVGSFLYAICLMEGEGVAKNEADGVRRLRSAAANGLAVAQWYLACCHMTGRGVPQDPAAATKLYLESAAGGFAAAQYMLGKAYGAGSGVEVNEVEATKWYRAAADQGYASAQEELARCLRYGWGAEKNEREAFRWHRAAAGQGNKYAQDSMGWCFRYGIGVEPDPAAAARWFRQSAEQGNPTAQTNLGQCYRDGAGVARDLSEAVKWYRLAAQQGEPTAIEDLRRLGQQP